ncbi:dihydrodipicolinate synthase family protein [Rhodococcus sp. IEGM1428]|uniref:dihydrodipicolinate synthase family protein n=1 Tax=Rhodococcus sp. IEGM1428 TaxID=3392191 RepID=UPI003D13ADBF
MDAALGLSGLFGAMATPFGADEDRTIDVKQTEALITRMDTAGVQGIVTLGSSGEFMSMTNAERMRFTEIVESATAETSLQTVVHVGAMTTAEAVQLSRHAEAHGAAAVMAVTPYYEVLTIRETEEYVKAIADSIGIPVMLYHIPGCTGRKWTFDELQRLGQIDGVQYVKDSSGDFPLLVELIEASEQGGITPFCGYDTLMLGALANGVTGAVWGATNVIPELCVGLFDAVIRDNDLTAAKELWRVIHPIGNFFLQNGYLASLKAGADIAGIAHSDPRLPMLPLTPEEKQQLAAHVEPALARTAGLGALR